MKQAFIDKQFRADSAALIEVCNQIIDRYLEQHMRLTLRQLYYQLVTENIIPNREQSYKRLGKLLSDGRLTGLVDWDAIEDRVRIPRIPTEFSSLKDLVDAALYSYRLPRWDGQEYYIELWVEKDALSGVLAPLAREYHVTLSVNRGYSSQSAMYEAAQRFLQHQDQQCVLLYLGDHDPSGEDMVRDIQDRLTLLTDGKYIDVQKIALTWDQVQQYQPPPNPTKLTDSRAAGYIEKYGEDCWEVDALPPETLQGLIRRAITNHLDTDKMDLVIAREGQDKDRLRRFVSGL